MSFTSLHPILRTQNIADTIRFYVDVLGFTCREHHEEWGWAALRKDEVEIMIAMPNAHEDFQQPQFTGSIYFRITDLDSLWNSINQQVKVCYTPEDFEWGMREFAIFDNNGYLLQFGQPIAS